MNENDLRNLLQQQGEMVTERLDHWASIAGDRPFFYYGEDDVVLTYAEFARRTDSIAGNLAAHGIAKGDHVSVFCSNSLLSTLAMFGVWKASAVYCPVNFSYAGRTLEYQINDTRPRMIVTEARLVEALNAVADQLEHKPAVTVYEPTTDAHDHGVEAPALAASFQHVSWSDLTRDAKAPDVGLSLNDPANLIYTSGTTGLAKGVLQSHRWISLYTYVLRSMLTSDDVIYNDLPMYHIAGAIANVCRAAWVGCEAAVWNRFSPTDFWSRIRARRATTAILIDVMIPWLTKASPSEDDRRNTLNKVHMQPLPIQHAEFARRFGLDFVSTGFGQTESGASIVAVIEEMAQGEGTPSDLYIGLSHEAFAEVLRAQGLRFLSAEEAGRKGLMGLPTLFTEVSIRDENDEECAPEQIGQLALRPRLPGQFLQSYWNKPDATLQALQNLWFHTGDAAVQAADGMFYFADRLGDRIRVRGENLSSSQVEDILGRHPLVQLCAVVGVPSDVSSEDEVAAFIVSTKAGTLTEDDLHEFARDNMPKYMRPRFIRLVDDVPRTPTNKIEKYKLRQIFVE